MAETKQVVDAGQYSITGGVFVKRGHVHSDGSCGALMTTSRDRFCDWILRDAMREDVEVQLAKAEVERRSRLDAALKSLESRMKFHNRVYFRIKYFIQKTLDRYGL